MPNFVTDQRLLKCRLKVNHLDALSLIKFRDYFIGIQEVKIIDVHFCLSAQNNHFKRYLDTIDPLFQI